MKNKIYFFVFFFTLTGLCLAQAPDAIPYQGVARDAAGNVLANQNISLRMSLHDVTINGTIVYQETHAITTTALGLFSVNIGNGVPITGTLGGVDWGSGSKFMQVEMDAAGGNSYIDMGTTQLMSVPYALHAKTAESVTNETWIKNGSDISYSDGEVGIGIATPAHPFHIIHSTTTANTISVEAGTPPSARDVLELKVDAATSDGAQFIEMERGTSIVAQVNTDGSAEFLNVTVEEDLDNTTTPEKGKVYANGLPIAYGYVSSGVTTASLITDFGIASVSKPASTTGEYRIVLNRTIVGSPVIIATSFSSSPDDEIVTANHVSATEIEINIVDGTGTGTNSNFYFVVFGVAQ